MSNLELISSTKKALSSLNARREALESEASVLTSELTAPTGESLDGPPMGIDTPLVDRDGYPRSDIDVYRARTLRGRLSEIRTDHQQLMKDIERHLQQLTVLQKDPQQSQKDQQELAARQQAKPKPKFDPVSGKWVVKNWDGTIAGVPNGEARSFDNLSGATSNEGGGGTAGAASSHNNNSVPVTPTSTSSTARPAIQQNQHQQQQQQGRPFAKVNAVAPHSPAEAAGLQENDLVLQFGNITLDSGPAGFQQLATLVPEAAGLHESIGIVVQRTTSNGGQESGGSTNVVKVQLVPRPWDGRGLIGCHIVPFHDEEENNNNA